MGKKLDVEFFKSEISVFRVHEFRKVVFEMMIVCLYSTNK